MGKYNKDTFDKISDEKKQKIIDAAVDEFAFNGFSSANVNVIAKNAGVSIGSMYNYFSSKEDLFMTLINVGYELLEEAIQSVDLNEGDIFDKFEKLIRLAIFHSKQNVKYTQIYHDMTTEGLSHLAKKLSLKMETITAKFYEAILNTAQKEGLTDKNIDNKIASFCIDNMILILQFSYTSNYFRERMKIFIGEDALTNDDAIVKGMMKFIRNALEK